MFRGITAHMADADDIDRAGLAELVRSHGPLDAAARVGIYARMYRARLTEALAEDHPRVAAVLGPEAFTAAAQAYVAAHPSTHPSLRWFGRGFADFLAARAVEGSPPYLADLARLEWTRLMVFDAPDAEPLDLATVRRIPASAWPSTRFEPIPALGVLRAAWPVHRVWDDAGGARAWEPEVVWLRVWRHGDEVFQVPMDHIEQVALDHVRAGDDFGTTCEGLATLVAVDDVAATAAGMVLRWIDDGVLRRPPGL